MQALVLSLIALCGVGIGVAGYFALALTPIEAGLLAVFVALAGWVLHERNLRQRAESRLEKAVSELRDLLATDARAGHVLSQRIKALDDLDLGARIDIVEADVSVLGTVVRQVAEAVSELETAQAGPGGPSARTDTGTGTPSPARGPTVPLSQVRKAVDSGGLVHCTQPVVTLPQRRLDAYHLIARLTLEDGTTADPPDYMPVRTAEGDMVIRRVERICAQEAIRIVRRGRLIGNPVRIWVDVSRATLSDRSAIDQLVALFSANRAINPDISLSIGYGDWTELDEYETEMLARLTQQGAGVAIREMTTLRHDFAKLAARGVRYVCVDAGTFIAAPTKLTEFHSSDITDYIERFGIGLVMSEIESEEQILSLLDDGVKLAHGPAIAPVLPLRSDLRAEDDDLRSAAAN